MVAPKINGESVSHSNIGLFRLSLVAIFVGGVTGFGAIGFRGLIGFIHNLFFLGRISFLYDANTYTPASPWGVFVILVPVVGALIVTLLVTKFAPEARGHGVPEVMDAVYYSEGRIRPMVAAIKSLASSLSIGSGAAVGREGSNRRISWIYDRPNYPAGSVATHHARCSRRRLRYRSHF